MDAAPLVVLVEDEEHLAQGLLFNLALEGYCTRHFADGTDALAWLLAAEEPVSAVLLDVMLPGTDGFVVVRTLREHGRYTPVLMLTARSHPEDVMTGLNSGADDYLPKPFALDMLLVRLKTMLRRAGWAQQLPEPAEAGEAYRFAGRCIHFQTLELEVPGRATTHLTLMEADLLRYLTEREGEIVPRRDLLEHVWRLHEDTDTRAVDNFIVRLRRYLEDDPGSPRHLLTVRGIGYRFLASP